MKKLLKIALLLSAASALFCACDPDEVDTPDGVAEITTISFTAAANDVLSADCAGVIDGTTINFVIPAGTSLTALVPTFEVTKDDVVTVGETKIESGVTAIDCSSAVTLTVADAKSNKTVEYAIKVSENDSKAELLSVGFYAADNAEKITEDYVADQIADQMIIRIAGGGAGKTLVMKFTAGQNDEVKVNNTAAEGSASVDCDFPIDITVTDAIANATKTYVVKVGKILEMQWTKAGEISDATLSKDFAMAADDASGEVYFFYGLSKTEGETTTTDMATVSKWNGSAFETVGSSCFSTGRVYYFSIDVCNGQPYVLFRDAAAPTANLSSVMTYKNASWQYVGAQGFGERMGAFAASPASIIVNPVNKQPMTAWSNNSAGVNVARRSLNISIFDGSNWNANQVMPGRSTTEYGYTPRYAANSSDVYLMVTNQTAKTSSLYKYASNAWTVVVDGFKCASTPALYYNSIECDSKGNLYAAMGNDSSGTWNIQLYKLNDKELAAFGQPINDELTSDSQYDMTFDSNDMPVVAYRSSVEPYNVKIVSIDPETKNWTEPFVCEGTANAKFTAVDKDANGTLYVAYSVAKTDGEGAAAGNSIVLYKYALEDDILPE